MTKVLAATWGAYDITIVPSIKKADMDRFCDLYRWRKDQEVRDDREQEVLFDSAQDELYSFTEYVALIKSVSAELLANGLAEAFLWALTACFHLTFADARLMLKKVIKREISIGSTGWGRGVAVPHCKSPFVERATFSFMWFRDEVFNYHALDGLPVDLFCLLLRPISQPGDGLRAQELISRAMRTRRADSNVEWLPSVVRETFGISEPYETLDL